MTVLVVYESMFGNTRDIAVAVARGLEAGGLPVELVEVGAAPTRVGPGHELVVAGGPTHAFSLSRASTRADAARRAVGLLVSQGRGLREWLEDVEAGPVAFAAFDTKVRRPRLPGSAARAAARRLRGKGWDEVTAPETFFVGDMEGPLLDGEVARAERWGTAVADAARRRHPVA